MAKATNVPIMLALFMFLMCLVFLNPQFAGLEFQSPHRMNDANPVQEYDAFLTMTVCCSLPDTYNFAIQSHFETRGNPGIESVNATDKPDQNRIHFFHVSNS
jgi:hypothetical protein